MKKFLLGWCLLLVLSHLPVQAQDRVVTGRVTASEDGSALPGVSVQVKGTTRGTTTDASGNFSINTAANNRLVFSFIGFATQEVFAGNQTTLNVRLENNANELSEVVVTGYGGTVNRREFTGASSKVSGGAIANLPVGSFDKALAGRAAGVQVTSANGVPGGAIQIRIRGIGSISAGSDPLYVVDGIQLNATSNASFTSSNPLAFLNPNDIESIEILKDAAAASIYGSQAANGVVLVTTKRGKSGRTQVSLNYYMGIDEPLKQLDVLNTQEWIALRTQARINGGQAADVARSTVFSTIRQPTTLTDAEVATLPTYNWQKEAFRTGHTNNYELNLSGGNDKTRFFVSGSFYQQNANVINVDFKRGTLNTTITHSITNKLTLEETLKLSTITQHGQQGSPNGGSFLGSSAFSASLMIPSVPIYNPDGSFYGTPDQGGTPGILNQNIIQVSTLNDIVSVINQFNGGLALNYKPLTNLTIRPFISLDYRAIKGRYFTDPRTADAYVVRGRLSDQFNQNINFLTNLTVNYAKTVATKHDFSGLLGVEYRSDVNEFTSSQITNVPTPDFRYGSAAALPVSVGGGWTGYHKASVFGNLKYNYNHKYDLSLIARLDGSSRFGANHQFGFFPSASAAWLLSEEAFLKGNRLVNELKLRASYGTTGNDQIGTLFGLSNFPSLGLVSAGYDYNGSAGFVPTQLGNPDLKWETNVTTNLGLDFGLFNNRITGSVDVFDRTSRDLLLAVNLPYTNGYNSISRNAGSVQNRGLEVELNTVNVQAGAFKWRTSFNITTIQNKVLKLIDGITPLQNPDSAITINYTDYYGVSRTAIQGRPLLPNYTTEYAGVNSANGRPMFYDYAGNITYTPITPRDQRYLGTQLPKFYGGFINSFSYGGLSVDVFFQYDYGRRSFNSQTSFLSELAGRDFNALRSVYERRWQKAGDITDVPRPILGNAETRGISSLSGSRTLEDASYLRLKQLRINYSIPGAVGKKIGATKANIYVQAQNLVTWTNWTSYDPEFIDLGAGSSGVVPNSRSYTAGINLTF